MKRSINVLILVTLLALTLGALGVSPAQAAGDYAWAKGMGGTGFDEGSGIAVDGSGNVYTTGTFEGTVDFDPGAGTADLTSAGSVDIFVTKLDASGNLVWAMGMGGTGYDNGIAIAVDGSGNVYTTGYFNGTADFDPGAGTANLTSAGNDDIFASKLDASGNFVWAKGMGGTGNDQGNGIAVDGSGNVYTTGYFGNTADFDPGAGTANLTSAGGTDTFVSKLDASGDLTWARQLGGTFGDGGRDIAVDGSGNVYTTGTFQGTVDFDPGAGTADLTSAGSVDSFVSKLDANGNYTWAERLGGTGNDQGYDIAVDDSGNVYTTGIFEGTVDFDPGAGTANLTSVGGFDIFVSKLDASGNYAWAKQLGGTSFVDTGYDIAVDGSGNVYTTGTFEGTADFDPGAGTANLTSVGSGDIFVSKLDASGNYAWARGMGGTGNDYGKGIDVDGSGNVYTTGRFIGTADFDPGAGTANLTSAGGFDSFVSKLQSNHTVSFNANGGSGSMSSQSANVPTALTTNAFTRAGYTFAGWNTAANGSGTAYADGAVYSFTADITLYAQWTAATPTFVDVPFNHWAWKYIESIYDAGITGGCSSNPLSYCPDQAVTRAQMAVFILKGMHGRSFVPPAATGTVFGDVPVSHWAAAWVEQMYAEGLTVGCGNGNYCPDQVATTRSQMAVFLLRAKHGSAYTPPAVGASTGFADVPVDYWAAAWIKQFAAEGITSGCGGGNYCPDGTLTRAEMAVFLQRTFNLPLP